VEESNISLLQGSCGSQQHQTKVFWCDSHTTVGSLPNGRWHPDV